MTNEVIREKYFSSPTLVVQESMASFFNHWLEDGKLQGEWGKHKDTSRDRVATFLQGGSSILFKDKKAAGGNWVEQSIENLEELEKAQLGLHFIMANVSWNRDYKKQVITFPQTAFETDSTESVVSETMIFMPEIIQDKNQQIDVTDILRKGLTNVRAFLNIVSLSEKSLSDDMCHVLESELQIFRQKINVVYQLLKTGQQKKTPIRH